MNNYTVQLPNGCTKWEPNSYSQMGLIADVLVNHPGELEDFLNMNIDVCKRGLKDQSIGHGGDIKLHHTICRSFIDIANKIKELKDLSPKEIVLELTRSERWDFKEAANVIGNWIKPDE